MSDAKKRYVIYPIQHNSIWEFYKKAVACFWVAEEIDLTKDRADWERLSEDERSFIKNTLAFFAASDGIVNENLANRFINEVDIAEAKFFYGFQIAMENIHCVTGSTKILTDKGYYQIKDLENEKVNIWNGEEFTDVLVQYTGDQAIYKVKLSNGMELDCTSGHKWLIQKGNPLHPEQCKTEKIETKDLKIKDIISRYELPVVNFTNPNEFLNPYMHGFFCGDGSYTNNYPIIHLYGKKKELLKYFMYNSIQENKEQDKISFYITKYINKPKFEVPINYDLNTRLRWLEGICDSDGCIHLNPTKDGTSIQISSIHNNFLRDIQLLLTTLGIHSNIKLNHKAENRLMPKNDGTGEYDYYFCKPCYILYISCKSVGKLIEIGFSPKRLKILTCDRIKNGPEKTERIKITEITKISDLEKTYCFNEPKKGTGIFNGILTCQSETYSLLIDTYVDDKEEKDRLFNAIENIPMITKKANWCFKWIECPTTELIYRLVAFACVEGIFFSSSFCSIYWLKKRGLMPGLTFSNELISRDESLHTEFAVHLFHFLKASNIDSNKDFGQSPCHLNEKVLEMVKEAVEIEQEFSRDSLKSNLIGMNSKLMSEYIEFVGDRLLVQLGLEKYWNTKNPFDFMELISMNSKTNFFESKVSQYNNAKVSNGLSTKQSVGSFEIIEDF